MIIGKILDDFIGTWNCKNLFNKNNLINPFA